MFWLLTHIDFFWVGFENKCYVDSFQLGLVIINPNVSTIVMLLNCKVVWVTFVMSFDLIYIVRLWS